MAASRTGSARVSNRNSAKQIPVEKSKTYRINFNVSEDFYKTVLDFASVHKRTVTDLFRLSFNLLRAVYPILNKGGHLYLVDSDGTARQEIVLS